MGTSFSSNDQGEGPKKNNLVYGIIILIIIGGALILFSSSEEAVAPTEEEEVTEEVPVENPEESTESGDVALPAARSRAILAKGLGIAESEITVVSVEEATWTDGCLGLAGPDEMCTQALVPGYAVTLEHKGTKYLYRTDKAVNQIRVEK